MSGQGYTRGHPVIVLLLVIGGWIAVRGAFWDVPRLAATQAYAAPVGTLPVQQAYGPPMVAQPAVPAPQFVYLVAEPDPGFLERLARQLGFGRPAPMVRQPSGGVFPVYAGAPGAYAMASSSDGVPWVYTLPAGAAVQGGGAQTGAAPQAAAFQPAGQAAQAGQPLPLRRWSADGWAMLRHDITPSLAAGNGSYGQSQAGMVLRYRVIPSSGYRPELYGRISQALSGAQEVEGALGASARPLPGVPVTLAAEARITQVNGRTSVRPAAFAVAQLPPVELPLGFKAEAYAQGGYVWGDYSSAFVDGQARAERPLVTIGKYDLNAGAGMWGGAQKGAARLDVGPTASVYMPVGKLGSRLSVDWRFRVAGDAEPSDGPAVTVSTGF
ncbi:hypothetical protein [Altererythrobacter fulvus]|uniref:hypothetical protein n=1 Tax=Caenibius fulvus TaxID=2126012 RepID=UPI003016ADD2